MQMQEKKPCSLLAKWLPSAKAEMLDAYEGKILQAKEELANQLDSNKKILERTETEYQYNIERQHKMENDDWEDVKWKRESALRAREELMNDRDAALKDLEESLNQRELAMKEQLAQAEKQIADAQEKGKLEAETEYNAKVKLKCRIMLILLLALLSIFLIQPQRMTLHSCILQLGNKVVKASPFLEMAVKELVFSQPLLQKRTNMMRDNMTALCQPPEKRLVLHLERLIARNVLVAHCILQ